MPCELLRKTARYMATQADTLLKRRLLWLNILDGLGLEEVRMDPIGVVISIEDSLFHDGSVQVTFAGYVRKAA